MNRGERRAWRIVLVLVLPGALVGGTLAGAFEGALDELRRWHRDWCELRGEESE